LLTINCKMESQKRATRFDVRYDIYSGLWCHKPMKELGFECDYVKLTLRPLRYPMGEAALQTTLLLMQRVPCCKMTGDDW
jgi:hypothetical protein